jgi:hypothetical protein
MILILVGMLLVWFFTGFLWAVLRDAEYAFKWYSYILGGPGVWPVAVFRSVRNFKI